MELDYEIRGNELIINIDPWTGRELVEPFVVKKWEIKKGGPAKQVDEFFQTQLLPCKRELNELRTRYIEDTKVNTHAKAILRKSEQVLKNAKLAKELISNGVESEAES